jgi:uncharacterized protein YijF (DUF1287 family)
MKRNSVLVCLTVALTIGLAAQRSSNFVSQLVAAADNRPNHPATYDPAYVHIAYPNGDVPANTGVCTDEIIRIYRAVGIDLQKEVHEDMLAHRAAYPRGRLDTNIDHRRVPNLQVFFRRNGQALPITQNNADYLPGDIVTWKLPGGQDHIGMVVDRKSWLGRPMVEHNIGEGPQIENVLFDWKITGHYRYRPESGASR